jgi:hypothetical protein
MEVVTASATVVDMEATATSVFSAAATAGD